MSQAAAAIAVAVLVTAVVLFVAWPFVAPERERPEAALSQEERRRLALEERRDAAYQALRDLEEDHRTGKVSAADYEAERTRLRREAGQALRELDRIHSSPATGED
jgi:flagellar biosynthesis/type III secretory pathway M-ring protein FliF/YscJ